jgi:hypothetical protein
MRLGITNFALSLTNARDGIGDGEKRPSVSHSMNAKTLIDGRANTLRARRAW